VITVNVACPAPPAPSSGTWTPNTITSFTGLDLQSATPGDQFQLWGSSSGVGAVTSGRLVTSILVLPDGSFLPSGPPSSWQAFNFLAVQRVAGTSVGAFVTLEGEGVSVSPTSFTWVVTLPGGSPAKNLNPAAWQAGPHRYNVDDVIVYPNGAYGRCTVGGVAGAVAPAPAFYGTLVDGGATFLATGPEGFQNGVQWINDSAANVWSGGTSGVSNTNGFGPIANGSVSNPPNQPAEVFVYSAAGGAIAVQAFV
jgi:hypothetical protein